MARARARCLRCDLRLVGKRASFDGSRGGTRGTLLALLLREGVGRGEVESGRDEGRRRRLRGVGGRRAGACGASTDVSDLERGRARGACATSGLVSAAVLAGGLVGRGAARRGGRPSLSLRVSTLRFTRVGDCDSALYKPRERVDLQRGRVEALLLSTMSLSSSSSSPNTSSASTVTEDLAETVAAVARRSGARCTLSTS
mmetsp:Transcript_5067/g.8203  ORF Transcript_5067/g.8203 Transcript_5067/m.8203 type:complete len:200 (+) Transcript_5067:153-752(+)